MLTAFEACIGRGDVALFPADTVYGLACDPEDAGAVGRLYALKGRPPEKPAAVMFFDKSLALHALGWLGPSTHDALDRLLPGAVTLLVPNPERAYPLACGPVPDVLGVRVPAGGPLQGAAVAVLQSSANHAGGPDARRVADVPEDIVAGVGLTVDAGDLPGVPSTVVDLRDYEAGGRFSIVREGAVPRAALEALL